MSRCPSTKARFRSSTPGARPGKGTRMLLSRFWYVVMAVVLGAVLFALFLATSMYDRASVRAMGEALAGDSQVVASYLRDDARKRSISLIVPALDDDIRAQLAKSSATPEKIPADS